MKEDTRGTRRPCSASATGSLHGIRHPSEEAARATSQPHLSRGPHFDLITKTGATADMSPLPLPCVAPTKVWATTPPPPFIFRLPRQGKPAAVKTCPCLGPGTLLPCAQGTLLHWSPLPPRFCPSFPKLPASVQKAGQSVSLHKHTLFLETTTPFY